MHYRLRYVWSHFFCCADLFYLFSFCSQTGNGRIADADLLPAEYPVCDSGWNGTAGGGIFCICSDLRYGGLLFPRRSRQNEKLLGGAAEESAEANSKIVVALNQLLGNKEMYLVLGIMAVTLIIVYLIRRMSIANAWQIAIASGILFETIGLIAGYMLLGISGKTVSVLVGNVISLLIAFVIQFLFFNLDYSRTERLQFEDDEYYYYVKKQCRRLWYPAPTSR